MNAPDATRPPAPEPVEAELAQTLPPAHHRLARVTHVALRVIPFILLAAAVWVLWREFHHLSWAAGSAAIAGWGLQAIAIALALSVLSFALMGAILERCGLAEDLLEGFGQLFGGIRGGLS